MLRNWIQSGQNADECEATMVLLRRQAQRTTENEELLTLQEMFERKIPIEKIRAVVSRGGGIPDSDAPGVAKLTKYWIGTTTVRAKLNESSTTSELRVATTAESALDVHGLEMPPHATSSGAPDMETLLADAQNSAGSTPAAAGNRSCVGFFFFCLRVMMIIYG